VADGFAISKTDFTLGFIFLGYGIPLTIPSIAGFIIPLAHPAYIPGIKAWRGSMIITMNIILFLSKIIYRD
jgi:hypothetical protein